MSAPTVIVVVDDDQALLDLLAELLAGPDRVVETVCGGEGVTAELLSVHRPKLVVMNPEVGGLSPEELSTLINRVRLEVGARFVLMVPENENYGPGLLTALSADDAINIPSLLRHPLAQLVTALGLHEEPDEPSEVPRIDGLSADEILSMDFEEPVSSPSMLVPPPISPTTLSGLYASRPSGLRSSKSSSSYRSRPSSLRSLATAATAAPVKALSKLVDDELFKAKAPGKPLEYDVMLDTLGDNNLYVDGGAIQGVFISTLFPPEPGAPMHLRLTFPWGDAFEVDGTVAWQRQQFYGRRNTGGVGVALTPADPVRLALERFKALKAPMSAPKS